MRKCLGDASTTQSPCEVPMGVTTAQSEHRDEVKGPPAHRHNKQMTLYPGNYDKIEKSKEALK